MELSVKTCGYRCLSSSLSISLRAVCLVRRRVSAIFIHFANERLLQQPIFRKGWERAHEKLMLMKNDEMPHVNLYRVRVSVSIRDMMNSDWKQISRRFCIKQQLCASEHLSICDKKNCVNLSEFSAFKIFLWLSTFKCNSFLSSTFLYTIFSFLLLHSYENCIFFSFVSFCDKIDIFSINSSQHEGLRLT